MDGFEAFSVYIFCLILLQILGHHLDSQQNRDLPPPCLRVLICKMGNDENTYLIG